MKRAKAYGVVAQELELWRGLAADELLRQVGAQPRVRVTDLDGEPVSIEVSVSWTDKSRTRVRVEALANGPSTWRMERVVEHIELPLRDRNAIT
jgi:hypothetical protein